VVLFDINEDYLMYPLAHLTAWLGLASIIFLVVLLVRGRIPAASLFAIWAVGFVLVGWVPQENFLLGYANSALVTLVLILLVSVALERSFLVQGFSKLVVGGSDRSAILRLAVFVAPISAFLNNTAVVAGLMGAISKQTKIAPSRLLIPLSFVSVLGGITTLVGTSTNLVVDSMVQQAGFPALGMFQFAAVGVPVALISLLALFWSSRSLPAHQETQAHLPNQYFLEAQISKGSLLEGKSIEENGMRELDGLFLLEIVRSGRLLSPVTPQEIIQSGDQLIFTGAIDKIYLLQKFNGLEVFGASANHLLASNLVEAVVSQQSDLVNKTLREVNFRDLFDAGVVGIRRGDRRLTGQLGRIELKVGDSLLLAVGPSFKGRHNIARNFHVLTADSLKPTLRPWQNQIVLGGFFLAIILAAAGLISLLKAMVILLGLLLVAGILSAGELRRRFPFEIWLIVGSALTIAAGLEKTGASALVAAGIQSIFGSMGPLGALIGVYLLTLLLTEIVTNNAAAALGVPIALATAQSLGVDSMPFIMATAYAASACFILPYGYQTHLMVYSAGRYRAMDYVRAGWPVSLAYGVTVIALVPLIFPF
jgi:di/tricarboxylate transporter